MNLREILNSGLEVKYEVAITSLRLALKAYFSTYQTCKYDNEFFDSITNTFDMDTFHPYVMDYASAYTESIVHFQHFTELLCKYYMREPITSRKNIPTILKEMTFLLNESDCPSDLVGARYILSHIETILTLNTLRNRIWHGGHYILWSTQLDIFIGKYILPFVKDATSMLPESWNFSEMAWKYESLFCTVDPINEIIKEASKSGPDHVKLAFLKELGRAAYNNMMWQDPMLSMIMNYDEIINKYESIAAKNTENGKPQRCPVCGLETLLLFYENDYNDADHGRITDRHVESIKCEYCGLEMDNFIRSNFGYSAVIPNYWEMK